MTDFTSNALSSTVASETGAVPRPATGRFAPDGAGAAGLDAVDPDFAAPTTNDWYAATHAFNAAESGILVVMKADELGPSNPAFTIIPGGFGASEQKREIIDAVLKSPAPVPTHSNVYTTTGS